jgi:hypothetical protein
MILSYILLVAAFVVIVMKVDNWTGRLIWGFVLFVGAKILPGFLSLIAPVLVMFVLYFKDDLNNLKR